MRLAFFILVFTLSVQSCKKTKLEGEMSVLIGEWRWIQTQVVSEDCNPYFTGPYTIYSPSINGYDYHITFIKKGKIRIEQSDKKDKCYRIIRDEGLRHNPGTIAFAFHLNKKNGQAFTVYYGEDGGREYLYSNDLPLGLVNGAEGCKGILSTFEKVE